MLRVLFFIYIKMAVELYMKIKKLLFAIHGLRLAAAVTLKKS